MQPLAIYAEAPAPSHWRPATPARLRVILDELEHTTPDTEYRALALETDCRACKDALQRAEAGLPVAVAQDEDGYYFAELPRRELS